MKIFRLKDGIVINIDTVSTVRKLYGYWRIIPKGAETIFDLDVVQHFITLNDDEYKIFIEMLWANEDTKKGGWWPTYLIKSNKSKTENCDNTSTIYKEIT